jgi:hypothetical protein
VQYSICTTWGDDDEDDDHGGSRVKDHEVGSTLPVKIRVCDARGRSVGSASLKVRAIGLSPTGSLSDSGKANPGNLFRFSDGRYVFNLSTKGLAPGAYTLDFTVGSAPTVFHYAFMVRPDPKREKKGDDRGDEKSDRR